MSLRAIGLSSLLCLSAAFVGSSHPQESSSRPAGAATASPDAPSAALRDLLAAACAHDETRFAQFLTARNAESFSRLTPAARVELMKRFVLLDGVGKPVLSANSGRPSLRCATGDGAADIQLGGADVRDNLALLPVDIRDASDTSLPMGEPHHILMGLVRENSAWRIVSIGMLFLDLPSLEVEWDQSAIGGNEQQALTDLKALSAAVEAYRTTYAHLPESLAKLGHGAKPSPDSAGLLDPELAAGERNGYRFRMVIVGASDLGAPAQYELSATPAIYGRTGRLSFFRDSKGKYHAADHRGAVGHSIDPDVD